MSDKTAVQQWLDSILTEAEQASNEKITKAMRLFVQCDDFYKGIILHELRPKLPLTAQRLRETFDTLDLIDGLDDLIDDMEYEVKARAEERSLL